MNLPDGFTAAPLPEGFTDQPPPPAGFTSDNPLQPAVSGDEPQKTNTEVPGFWSTIGSAFSRGLTQRVADDVAGAQVVLPEGLGGKTLEQQFQTQPILPETKDEINTLLAKRVNEGWSDPKWWGAQIAHGAGSTVPGAASAVGGALVGGLTGGAGGFGAEGALGTIVPAYKNARADGLDPDAATTRALVDSGISASVATAMGLAPGVSFFGKTAGSELVNGQVATMLKRPVMETMAQIGLVQPSLAVGGELATALTHGETPNPWDLATTGIVGVGMGGAMVGAHSAIRGINAARNAVIPAPLADAQSIRVGYENQKPKEGAPDWLPLGGDPNNPTEVRLPEGFTLEPQGPRPAPATAVSSLGAEPGPTLSALDETLYPRESRIFFSPVKEAIEKRLPDQATVEQTIATLKNTPGVKEEEILDLGLPSYLADVNGRVNKKDLLAHIEANGLVLEEAQGGESELIKNARILGEIENGPGSWERIGGGGQDHYISDARRAIQLDYVNVLHAGEERYGYNHSSWPQEAKDALAAKRTEVDSRLNGRSPEYPGQVAPGPHSNYREFVLKTPPQGPSLQERALALADKENGPGAWNTISGYEQNKYLDRAKSGVPEYVSSHWPEDINPIAHIRTTDRLDRDGRSLLHVEEIQSDLHQEGRKVGYKDKSARSYDEIMRERRALEPEFAKIQEKYVSYGSDDYMRDPMKPEEQAIVNKWRALSQEWRDSLNQSDKLPDLPFKSSWDELAVKRILRLAADEGYDGISWANGDQVGLRQASPEQLRGSREFYDKKISSIFKRWAKKLGADAGTTKLDLTGVEDLHSMHEARLQQMGLDPRRLNEVNNFIEVNPAAGSRIRQGLPLYEDGPERKHSLSEAFQRGTPKALEPVGKKIIQIMGQIGKDLKISRDLRFTLEPSNATWRGKAQRGPDGAYNIRINTNRLRTAEDLYATAAHELGHVIMWDKFATADNATKTLVLDAFRKFRDTMVQTATTVGEVRSVRDNAVSEMTGARDVPDRQFGSQNSIPLSDLLPRSRSYLLHFEEWFAEQVAKWATTSDKPLSRVDSFFAKLGKSIRSLIERFNLSRSPVTAEPTFVMKQWLDSMMTDMAPFASDIKDKLEFDTKRINANALDKDGTPEVLASPITASTIGGRNIIDRLPPDPTGASGGMAAHADRMNKFYEWMTSLPQIADMNKQIRGLTMYKEIVATMNIEKNNIMSLAADTLKQWKNVRDPRQQVAIGKFIDDYMNGLFKDPSDTSGTIRRPTQDEFAKLVAKHGLSAESLGVFNKVVKDFDQFLEGYRQLLLSDAVRIKDPDTQIRKMADINKRVDEILQRPYMPAMRFGKYTITVYDEAGNVKHFEQTESLRKQRGIADALAKSHDLLPGDRVRTGEVPKDAAPLLGMPPGLLDLMADKLDLSTTQRDMLDQLRFDYAPSQSFRHQFKTKDLTPGYSTDFQRAYANFFFHGANHVTRVKWVDALRDQIREVKAGSVGMNDAVKRDQIANYMTEHLKMLVDPKPDFAALRGLMFHWYLGFNPASATLNLSQTALMTYPHLASKFGGIGLGDLRSVAALARASTDLNNFYKKGSLTDAVKNAPSGPTGSKMRALGEAVREGVISETQAHTLAAVSEGRNLLQAFGTKGEEAWNKFSNASSWMFEMTEQYNRRVAFRAAWDLAMRDPNNKYVAETIRDNPLQYKRLLDQGWSHQEAAAFTAAKDSVEKTQFVYAPYSRPKFMWGRKGALFIFKSFVQNTLFNLYNNPAMAARTLLILGGVGGMMGLPGMEDVNGILKALAYRLFGKDFDLEDEARKFAVDVLHGAISPDMLLHGTSVKGFGIPAVMDALGHTVGLPHLPVPVLDRHNSIGMGNVLPFEPGKAFGPTKDAKVNELQQLQRASGAGFGLGFALYNFVQNSQDIGSLKRWEAIMPRAMSNASHAFRFATNGAETTASGSAVVRFNMNDTEQMAEVLARAMGYQPRRLTAQYESIGAKAEQATFWDLRKQLLLRQFAAALKGGNPEEKSSVLSAIKNYNSQLPDEAKAKAISASTIRESIMTKFKVQAKQELGIATSKQNVKMFKEMDKYFPDAKPPGLVGVTPVK